MNPRAAVAFLRSIADGIDASKKPSVSLVASDLVGLIIAVETDGAIDADFAATFDRAFNSISRMLGDQDTIPIHDLRQKFLRLDPELFEQFNEQVLAMRDAGLIELQPYDKNIVKLPDNYIKGGIKDGGEVLVWVSKKKEAPTSKTPAPLPYEYETDVPTGA